MVCAVVDEPLNQPIRADIATRFQPGNQLALGQSGGRPVNYTEEMLDQLAIKLYEWMQLPESIYVKSFCFQYGLLPQKIEDYCNRSPVFREAWLQSKEWQEAKLVTQALNRKTAEGMTKFVLVNVHKWKEKTEVSGDSANPLALVLADIAKKNQQPIDIQEVEPDQLTQATDTKPIESIQP